MRRVSFLHFITCTCNYTTFLLRHHNLFYKVHQMAAFDTTSSYDRLKEVKEFDESKIGVKGLSDSGITSIPRIFIHPPENLPDGKSSSSSAEIPVIDLSNINSPDQRLKIVEQIREAASTWGFFQVINHGVPLTVLDDTIAAVKAFHDQPPEVKAKLYKRNEGRGFMYATNNDLYRSKAANWRDTFSLWMGPETPEIDAVPEISRKEVAEWDVHATMVAENVEALLAEGLGLGAGKFKELRCTDSKLFLGICYPYCPQPDLTVGFKAHTDAWIVTVLLQNQVLGLQVKYGEEWVDVKPVHGGLIINVGDFLQIFSNGQYQSVEHRVRSNSSKEARISIVMFFSFAKQNESAFFGPLPELLSPEKPAIYRDFTMEEFLEDHYSKGFESKSIIDKIKI